MMKKIIVSLIIMAAILMTFTGSLFASSSEEAVELPNLKIIVDGKLVKCENTPILVQGNTLLPLREMAAILGVPNDDEHIIYNNIEKSVTIINGQTKIVVYIGRLDAFVNDELYELKVSPVIYGKGYTYIPFRFIAEALGKKVLWDGSADAILICDADKFDNIKAIMTKSNEASEKVQKCRVSMDVAMDIYSETISTKVGMVINYAIDKANKKVDMQLIMDMLGMQIKTQYYYADNVSYSQNPFTQEWEKTVYMPSEYEMVLEHQINSEAMQLNDTICAGINQIESTDENEILLKGDVFLTELFDSIMSQQMLGDEQEIDQNVLFEECTLEITLDKNTYLVKSMLMTMKVTQQDDLEDFAVDAVIEYTFSDYDGDFEIIVPDEVIESAVEVDLGETMLQ
jgi:hypothetical protein